MQGSRQTEKSAPHSKASAKKLAWSKTLPDQIRELGIAFATQTAPITAEQLARTFSRARTNRVADHLLETRTTLGQARRMDDGQYLAEWQNPCMNIPEAEKTDAGFTISKKN